MEGGETKEGKFMRMGNEEDFDVHTPTVVTLLVHDHAAHYRAAIALLLLCLRIRSTHAHQSRLTFFEYRSMFFF